MVNIMKPLKQKIFALWTVILTGLYSASTLAVEYSSGQITTDVDNSIDNIITDIMQVGVGVMSVALVLFAIRSVRRTAS